MARRTKQDAQATRAALLDAAERVFLQRGVSRASLAEVAQAAGVTRGALYWHFKDKSALFNAMMDRVTLPLSSGMEDILAQDDDPLHAWCEHVLHALRQIVQDARTRRVLQIAMQKIEHVPDTGAVFEHHVQATRRHVDCVRRVFEQAASRRNMTLPAPALELAQGCHALIGGLIYDWLLDPGFDLERTGRLAVDTFLRGIRFEAPADHG